MEAFAGSILLRPAKNATMARAVETSAMASTETQPKAVPGNFTPFTATIPLKTTPAEMITMVEAGKGTGLGDDLASHDDVD